MRLRNEIFICCLICQRFMIPSVHEAMITKENTYTENKQLEGLSEIVKRIYAIVDDMEKLSDRIYIYERANGKIRLLI